MGFFGHLPVLSLAVLGVSWATAYGIQLKTGPVPLPQSQTNYPGRQRYHIAEATAYGNLFETVPVAVPVPQTNYPGEQRYHIAEATAYGNPFETVPVAVPVPQTNYPGVQRYHIAEATAIGNLFTPRPVDVPLEATAIGNLFTPRPVDVPLEVCGTDSKCGNEGGFCISKSEACNQIPIVGKGYCNATYSQMGCKCCTKPTVYMRDIENTIAYALRNQAPYTINGAPYANGSNYQILNITLQKTLSDFTKALVHHLPLSNSTARFLNCLSGRLPTLGSIRGQELENLYGVCIALGGELPHVREWVGCQNFVDNPGRKQFRSYPCGVWTTFHAMTVNLAQSTQKEASSLLPTLYHLVYRFPWCNGCKGDFIGMYNADKGATMKTAEAVTMWLWRAHNIVTKRVAVQKSNKGRSQLQFPGIAQCPGCCLAMGEKDCQVFNTPEVYSYLKELYKKDAIVPDL